MSADVLMLSESQLKQIADQVKLFLQTSHPCCACDSSEDELLTVDELARILKVKPSWVYNRVYNKQLPFLKAGKHLRFHKERVFEYLFSENGRVVSEERTGEDELCRHDLLSTEKQ